MGGLFGSLQSASHDTTNLAKQTALMDAARTQMNGYLDFRDMVTSVAKNLSNPSEKGVLDCAIKVAGDAIGKMSKSIGQVGDVEDQALIEAAMQEFDATKQELTTAQFFAVQGLIKNKSGQTRDGTSKMLHGSTDDVETKLDDLIAGSTKSQSLVVPITDLATSIGQMATAAQHVASTIPDRQTQNKIIGTAKICLKTLLVAYH